MSKFIYSLILLFAVNISFGQVKTDLDKSVPLWLTYDSISNQSTLNWIGDENATNYFVSAIEFSSSLTLLATLEGNVNQFALGELNKGEAYKFHIRKGNTGTGIITAGIELPVVHNRGRCLIAIDKILTAPLEVEIAQLMIDLEMDGWEVDTLQITQEEEVVSVKSKIDNWYDSDFDLSQTLYLLGHIPVPYSGNSSHDGHPNHQGAWAADVFYGDLNGNWTDTFVNNITPSRDANKNIPEDGKYDQTNIPSDLEIEIGRVDFHNLPAFADNEIELTRKYLNKSRAFRLGKNEYPRRAIVENNFASFPEGFGQSGWRNFVPMFGGDSVTIQNYETVLETEKYLCSYACGGGSYTSCAGVGTTQNLWVAKNIQTVFTLNFGSYFGDWDSQNNFLRSSLASGDVLTNAWAGRPVWQLYDMALGNHIGQSAKFSQDATGFIYNLGFSANSAHMALMGDPTLRLHAIKTAENLQATFMNGDVELTWDPSPESSHGHTIYKREVGREWQILHENNMTNSFTDICVNPNTTFEYMVKAIRLEDTGSGSYYNTSLGISMSIQTGENPLFTSYYADLDMDTFGDPDNMTEGCALPPGFVENNLDCDDSNFDINPNGEEIPNNGVDEDCNGEDLLVGINELDQSKINIYPNPTDGIIHVNDLKYEEFNYRLFNAQGKVLKIGILKKSLNLDFLSDGLYWLELSSGNQSPKILEPVILSRY